MKTLSTSSRWLAVLMMVLITTTALVLRLWGIRFGLPYAYHVDEPTYVSAALNLGAGIIGKQPNPTGFSNMLFGEYALYFVVGRLVGLFISAADFESAYRSDPSVFLLLARLTSVLFGTLTVLVVYRLGRAIRDRFTGVVAALLLAAAFLPVRDAHYGVPDISATFLVVLAAFSCVRATQSPDWRYLWLAGFSTGLAITFKWSLWLVLVPFALAVYWQWCSRAPTVRPRMAWGIALISLVFGALMGGFQLFLRPAVYFDYALREWRSGAAGGFGFWQIDTVSGWVFYLETLSYGLGVLMLALAIIGLGLRVTHAIRERDKSSAVLVVFPLLYFVTMGATRHYFARYALPLTPFAALFAAEAIMTIGAWFSARSPRMERTMVAGLVLVALIQPLAASIRHNVLLTRTDTRTEAKAWIEQNIPAGAKVAVDWQTHGPPLATSDLAVPYSNRVYDVTLVGGTGLADHPISWYRENGFEYLIASSFIYQIPLVYQDTDQVRRLFYDALGRELTEQNVLYPTNNQTEPAFIFDEIYGPAVSLWQRDQPGPTIRIFRVTP